MFVRKAITLIVALTFLMSLAGCMNSGDEARTTAAPSVIPAVTAETTAAPGSVDSFDWRSRAGEVEDALVQLSEISEARVAIAGNTALVGVKFDPAYQGELTDRIREMVSGIVKAADPQLETVAVTATEEDVTKVFDMSDRVRAGEAFESFKDDITSIVRNITTMR